MSEIVGPQRSGRKGVRFDTRVPVRYVVKSALAQETSMREAVGTNMSSEGIRFETTQKLQPGMEIQVEILLGESAKVKATGKVIRSIPKEDGIYDIALTFTEIGDTAREEINMWYYSEKFRPNPIAAYSAEASKRKSERFRATRAFAEYRKRKLLSADPWKQADIKEVSKHGLLISTRSHAREGEIWDVMIHLGSSPTPVKAVAKVARVKWEGMTTEVALELTKIREKDREKLSESAYIKEMVDRADNELS